MNIIRAIDDKNLFRPFLGDDLTSWRNWLTALRVLYGLPLSSKAQRRLVRKCTGRKAKRLPAEGFDAALYLIGRRSGKSRAAALIGAYEAAMAGHETKLAKGERGVVPIMSPTKYQSRIVRDYLRSIFETPLLAGEVVAETREGFDLRNGTRIEILAGDWRTVRGYTLQAAIIEEACFFGYDSESKVRSDTELIRAVKPSLATVGGKLVCISSPYARRGWCYQQWKRHYGNNYGSVLVWNCSSRLMNPTLPQSVIDSAIADDLQAAKSEYLGEFRDDVVLFLPREVIEACVAKGQQELLPRPDITYSAFADISGGRGDDAALAIAHLHDGQVIVDCIRRYKPPFAPDAVIADMADVLRWFKIKRCSGDRYAADFVTRAFQRSGIRYINADRNKSALYLELLPRLCSGEVVLPDNEVLISQLSNLERRTRSGGKDVVDHPHGHHDDVANAVAGVCVETSRKRLRVGVIAFDNFDELSRKMFSSAVGSN